MGWEPDLLRPPHGTRAQLALVAHGGDTTSTIRYGVQAVGQLMAMPQPLWHLKGSNQGQKGAISAFAYVQVPPPPHFTTKLSALLITRGY